MAAHSGVSGIFQTERRPLASPRIKYLTHLPSREKMRYLKDGGQSSGGPINPGTSSQKTNDSGDMFSAFCKTKERGILASELLKNLDYSFRSWDL